MNPRVTSVTTGPKARSRRARAACTPATAGRSGTARSAAWVSAPSAPRRTSSAAMPSSFGVEDLLHRLAIRHEHRRQREPARLHRRPSAVQARPRHVAVRRRVRRRLARRLLDQCAQGVRVRRRSAASNRAAAPSRRSIWTGTNCPSPTAAASSWGVNYEYAIGEDTTLGATYMSWSAKEDMRRNATGWTCTTCARSRRHFRA